VRLSVRWGLVAPDPGARRPPKGFDATNPADYPATGWAAIDAVVRAAAQDGITVDLDLQGGAPAWARGPHEPKSSLNPSWEPNPRAYERFVEAVGTRYGGSYDPTVGVVDPGNPADLPRVGFWTVWNEPDYGPSLAPQGLLGDLEIPHSPEMYRKLVDAAWTGLHATGHGDDTFVFGELAPRGKDGWGVFSGMKPLTFIRSLYCLNARERPLRGRLARREGCPSAGASAARFRARHPALFDATAFSDHPYSRYFPPDIEAANDPQYTSLADIGNLTRALDAANRAYGSSTEFPIYDTEYGYITSPPKLSPDPKSVPIEYYVSPVTAAAYLNQAEYMSWLNPRIESFMQYLLRDEAPRTAATDWGGFASGLEAYSGQPKATYDAWRLPLYLPITTTTFGSTLEVWGAIRPARFALLDDPQDPEVATIQFEPAGAPSFSTVAEIPVTNPEGYFEERIAFGASGTVRLEWTYPSDDAALLPGAVAYSRPVQITVR
jgi:hypothetical protein